MQDGPDRQAATYQERADRQPACSRPASCLSVIMELDALVRRCFVETLLMWRASQGISIEGEHPPPRWLAGWLAGWPAASPPPACDTFLRCCWIFPSPPPPRRGGGGFRRIPESGGTKAEKRGREAVSSSGAASAKSISVCSSVIQAAL